jgi:hypothetical protein
VPLSALARFESTLAPLSVSHQGGSAAATISFALPEGAPSARPPSHHAALAGIGAGGHPHQLRGLGRRQKSMSTSRC